MPVCVNTRNKQPRRIVPHPTRALKNSAFAICISAAVLTGCAVEPSPLSEQEMSVAAQQRRSASDQVVRYDAP